jgi:hypothetical protein
MLRLRGWATLGVLATALVLGVGWLVGTLDRHVSVIVTNSGAETVVGFRVVLVGEGTGTVGMEIEGREIRPGETAEVQFKPESDSTLRIQFWFERGSSPVCDVDEYLSVISRKEFRIRVGNGRIASTLVSDGHGRTFKDARWTQTPP